MEAGAAGLTGLAALRVIMLEALPLDSQRDLKAQIEISFWGRALGNPALRELQRNRRLGMGSHHTHHARTPASLGLNHADRFCAAGSKLRGIGERARIIHSGWWCGPEIRLGGPVAGVVTPPSAREGDSQYVEADDTVKVPEIGCADAPPGADGGRGDDPVVCPDVLARRRQPCPDAGMRAGGEKLEGQRRERGQDGLDEGLPAGPVLGGGAVHAVQQFRGGDGGDPDVFVRPELLFQAPAHLDHGASRRQAPDGALEVDENGGV
jgi:hypothetical protein